MELVMVTIPRIDTQQTENFTNSLTQAHKSERSVLQRQDRSQGYW